MRIEKVKAVFFSPTGNTKKIVTRMGEEISGKLSVPLEKLDYTNPKSREAVYQFDETDLVIFGTPVYAGRVPNKLLPYLQTGFEGGKALAIPVVTFGNRNFDNGLIELCHELEGHGFHTIAGAAIAARHAFSDKIATGRPDEEDWKKITDFAGQVTEKIQCLTELPAPVEVPGEWPLTSYYKPLGRNGEPTVFLKAKPLTHRELCDHCMACAARRPMAAIDFKDPTLIPGTCIKCQSCVRICHTKAKYFEDEAFLSHVAMLEENYTRRFEPEFFL